MCIHYVRYLQKAIISSPHNKKRIVVCLAALRVNEILNSKGTKQPSKPFCDETIQCKPVNAAYREYQRYRKN